MIYFYMSLVLCLWIYFARESKGIYQGRPKWIRNIVLWLWLAVIVISDLILFVDPGRNIPWHPAGIWLPYTAPTMVIKADIIASLVIIGLTDGLYRQVPDSANLSLLVQALYLYWAMSEYRYPGWEAYVRNYGLITIITIGVILLVVLSFNAATPIGGGDIKLLLAESFLVPTYLGMTFMNITVLTLVACAVLFALTDKLISRNTGRTNRMTFPLAVPLSIASIIFLLLV